MSRRAVWPVVTGVAAVVLGVLGLPGPAGAVDVSGPWRLVDLQTGRCLDSNYAGEVYTLPCNDGLYQGWYRTTAPSGTSTAIFDSQTGRCLDSNTAGSLYTLPCNAGNYQQWVANSSDQLTDLQTGLCLDSNDAGDAYTLACNLGDYQVWNIVAF